VVIFTDGYERFQAVKIENPADHFKGKKVRVTGTIRKSKETKDYKNRLEIKLVEPDNIKIVSRESSSDNSESEKDGKEGKDGKDKPTTESPNKKPADKDSSKE
jgi:DNA/RNA endonuclease YhcR with UshA esterase domain